VQNPAFAKVEAASAKGPGIDKKILIAAAIFLLLLLAAGAYVFIFSGAKSQTIAGSRQAVPLPPAEPPPSLNNASAGQQNSSPQENSQTPMQQEQSPTPEEQPAASEQPPSESQPPQPAVQLPPAQAPPQQEPVQPPAPKPEPQTIPVTIVPENQSNGAKQFASFKSYLDSAFSPSEACKKRGGELVAANFSEYFGSDCAQGNFKGVKGTTGDLSFSKKCIAFPCCINIYNESYSIGYGSFTCGFY